MSYLLTVGLEVHAELKTKTKLFCNSRNDSEEQEPNKNICPVCVGHPGTLPVLNKAAVRSVLRVGLALGGKFADYTEFDRKNYFYPDLPKGYQISQFKYPLISGGSLRLGDSLGNKEISIQRIHLEEDTARSQHAKDDDHSLVDFNRAGVPLMELVTDPVIESPEEASAFAREFQLLLRYLGVSSANMERGEMRVEANISIRTDKEAKLGTKVEVKNLNSFRAVEGAIRFEILRQSEVLDAGGKLVQETRGWDEARGRTFSQRIKEDSHDYRYFPEPDLPKLIISKIPEFSLEVLQQTLGELPWERRERYKLAGVKSEDAEQLVSNRELGRFFDEVFNLCDGKQALIILSSNYITSDLIGLSVESSLSAVFKNVSSSQFFTLMKMVESGEVSSRGAKEVLKIMTKSGGNPQTIALENGFVQKSDIGELASLAQEVIAVNDKVVVEYKAGKENALQYLVGQGMKLSRGSANPELLRQALLKILDTQTL